LKLRPRLRARDGHGVWFKFEAQVDLQTQGEYGGFRQVFRAGIGPVLKNLKKAQIVNFDLGIGDPITPEPTKATTATLLSGEDLSWSVSKFLTLVPNIDEGIRCG